MNNNDKLICLFESLGLDVKEMYEAKQKEVFRNKTKDDFISSLDAESRNDVLRYRGNTYMELCMIQSKVGLKGTPKYEQYPTNPFLCNYHSVSISEQKIGSCLCYINGEMYSIDYIRDSKTSKDTKINMINMVKKSWQEEAKEYVQNRRNNQLRYMEQQAKQFKVSYLSRGWFLWFRIALFFLLLVSCIIPNWNIGDLRGWALGDDFYDNVNFLLIVLGINIGINVLLLVINYPRRMRRVSTKYADLYNKACDVEHFSNKILFSNVKLKNVLNFRRNSDGIDSKYIGEQKADIYRLHRAFKTLLDISLIMVLILAFMCLNTAFVFCIILIVVVFGREKRGGYNV